MAHIAAAAPSPEVKKERLSFAKIAAAGMKHPNAPQSQNPNSNHNHKQLIPSTPRDADAAVTPSNGSDLPALPVPRPKKLLPLQSRDTKDTLTHGPSGPKVRVQGVDSAPSRSEQPAPDGYLVPVTSDDVGTHVSSSSGSNKPPSVDGKSVASGTTFALDEKESLRPDDSASVKAADDEDMYSASGSGLPSRVDSDDGVRAFRDQLREISSMEPSRRGGPPPTFAAAPKGVLYVPPQGLGVGSVPSPIRGIPTSNPSVDFPPDLKLLEALENPRDRIWVLKLEQDVIDFVKDNKESSLLLPQCNTFYRLLAHKMADYYMLGHLIDDTSEAVRIWKNAACRIPPPLTGITAPSTAASTPPPAGPMKILKRGENGPAAAIGSNVPSKGTSETGDSGDEKKKGPVTLEERAARYEAARLRIMGSARPTASPETPREKQDSRSSSANGRKYKKKARDDDDDDFDRSAYSNYFTTPFNSEGVSTPPYGYPPANDTAPNQFSITYGQDGPNASFQPIPMHAPVNGSWPQQPYHSSDPTQAWAQTQSGAYDLSADFQRSMSFQNSQPQAANMAYSQGYPQNYPQQYCASQQGWQQQQQHSTPPQVSQPAYGHGQPGAMAAQMPPMPQQQLQDPTQSYAFGQLPSQTIGRPPNKNEHPLPGSYKGKHFNPQSQTFVPGQAEGRSFSAYGSPIAPMGFGQALPNQQPPQLSRHSSAHSQGSIFPSPYQVQPQTPTHRMGSLQLAHALPQGPAFPRHPSPNVPLPPKPATMQPPPPPNTQQPASSPAAHAASQNQSILAKWGAPPSLPAKPPPANEPYDSAKLTQIQRQPFSAAAAARQQGGFPVRM